jgi:curved DNA-binding protein CbpA
MDVEEAYRILDLEVGSTLTEVKEQYKLLLQFYHPDKHTKSPEKLKHKATLRYAENRSNIQVHPRRNPHHHHQRKRKLHLLKKKISTVHSG